MEHGPAVDSAHNLTAAVRGILDAYARVEDEFRVDGALTGMSCVWKSESDRWMWCGGLQLLPFALTRMIVESLPFGCFSRD